VRRTQRDGALEEPGDHRREARRFEDAPRRRDAAESGREPEHALGGSRREFEAVARECLGGSEAREPIGLLFGGKPLGPAPFDAREPPERFGFVGHRPRELRPALRRHGELIVSLARPALEPQRSQRSSFRMRGEGAREVCARRAGREREREQQQQGGGPQHGSL